MTIKVEITSEPDFKRLAHIHALCFDKAWTPSAIAEILAISGTVAMTAEDGSGFALVRHLGEEAELLTLAVLPEKRRCGIGHALAMALLKWSKATKAKTVFLEVSEHNEAARNLYTAHGFEIISRRKEYYRNCDGSHSHALVMRVILR